MRPLHHTLIVLAASLRTLSCMCTPLKGDARERSSPLLAVRPTEEPCQQAWRRSRLALPGPQSESDGLTDPSWGTGTPEPQNRSEGLVLLVGFEPTQSLVSKTSAFASLTTGACPRFCCSASTSTCLSRRIRVSWYTVSQAGFEPAKSLPSRGSAFSDLTTGT
jgi:hypothetical protein